MTYLVNGVPLDNPDQGWSFQGSSRPLADVEQSFSGAEEAGRDGVVVGAPGDRASTTMVFVVRTPRAGRERLLALFAGGGTITTALNPGMEATRFAFISSSTEGFRPNEHVVDLSVALRVPDGAWRSITEETFEVAPGVGATALTLFAGMTATVQDAVLRFRGAATGIQITDSSGAWLTLPTVAASTWVRFDSSTGRAWLTSTDSWVGGEEISGLVDFGGPRGRFEIAPSMTAGDPTAWSGRLIVTTATRASALLEVRGKSARLL